MHVCLILFPGFQMLAFVFAREVLRVANKCAGQDLFTWQTRTVSGAPVAASDGTEIAGDKPSIWSTSGFCIISKNWRA